MVAAHLCGEQPALFTDPAFKRSGGGGNYLVAVKMGGRGNVLKSHMAYKMTETAPYVPTPLVVGDRVFAVNDPSGTALWLEAATGKIFTPRAAASASPSTRNGRNGNGAGTRS